MMIARRIRKFQEERAHNRQPCTRHLFRCGVKVEHQPVAFFNVVAADRFLFRPVHPRLLIVGPNRSVISVNWLEGPDLKPLGQQICLRRAGKAADVRAAHSESAQAKILNHRCRHPQMIPGRAVVARP